MRFLEILKAIIIGIVEGITEWLPISSTGHMILLDEFIHLDVSKDFRELFFVVIQLGAILAVPILFMEKLNPFSKKESVSQRLQICSTWTKVLVGALPAAVLGVFLDDLLDRYFYTPLVVALALTVYGIIYILIEKIRAEREDRVKSIKELSYKDALKIGFFQSLSLVPGTSRSGSTILGGLLFGLSREASAEFSFFMAIPIMLGASLFKILKFLLSGFAATLDELMILLVGMSVSFIVSVFVIRFLMRYVKSHGFMGFGYYRIALSVFIFLYFGVKRLI